MAVSVGVMVKKIHALVGTQDVNDRTSEFILNVWQLTEGGLHTAILTEAQVAWIEDIHARHYS